QDQGADTLDANLLLGHPADARDYRIAAEILREVGIDRVCLLTNNPDKTLQLQALDIDVVESMPLVAGVSDDNREYLITKAERMGHSINTDELN
ncbi:TPA: GTP cyclohydrolase II, partial [Candidatus Thalassarchaeaceae archaeon]